MTINGMRTTTAARSSYRSLHQPRSKLRSTASNLCRNDGAVRNPQGKNQEGGRCDRPSHMTIGTALRINLQDPVQRPAKRNLRRLQLTGGGVVDIEHAALNGVHRVAVGNRLQSRHRTQWLTHSISLHGSQVYDRQTADTSVGAALGANIHLVVV